MKNFSNKKNKINLEDYNYRKDIQHRVILSNLSFYDLDVLREIVDGPLKITVGQLAEVLDGNVIKLYQTLDKLKETNLFTLSHDLILVEKEMRKYYELHLNKFNVNFQPGLDFLQTLLAKVPFYSLPTWYPICRSSDNFFNTIVEKYLLTPRIYERYLNELDFENPILKEIQQDLFKSADFKLPAKEVLAKFNLKREEFEEILLHLEFNFVCCLCYEKKGESWEEVITPFYEWHEYLRFRRDHFPKTIPSHAKIEKQTSEEFEIIKRFNQELNAFLAAKTPIENPHFLKRALQLQLLTPELEPTPDAQYWLSLPIEQHAYILYNLFDKKEYPYDEKDMREVERSFKSLATLDWIYYEDMLKSFSASLGKSEPFVLKNKGKKWKYTLPDYGPEEKHFIENMVCVRLHEAGMVQLGHHNGRLCLSLTPFGVETFCL